MHTGAVLCIDISRKWLSNIVNILYFSLVTTKQKIEVGEPGFAISSGVRGKKSIVPATSYLGALDHDVNQKGTITPSVVMCCDIPANITESFYRRQVFVGLKDSVFQASSSFHTVLETIHALKTHQKSWHK